MDKKYYLFVNGKKIEVSEEIYKVYWQEKNHENYLKQIDKKNHLLLFSSLYQDGHFEGNVPDDKCDLNKVVQTQIMIEAVRDAVSKLTDEEKEIIQRLYYDDETLRMLAKDKKISHPAMIKRRDKILSKLKVLLKDHE